MSDAISIPRTETAALTQESFLADFLQGIAERRLQLVQVARRMARRNEDAEDILQEAYLRAYSALPHFRGDCQMSTWLTSIIKNTALEHLRRQRGRVFLSIDNADGSDCFGPATDFPDPRPNPEEIYLRSESIDRLLGELQKLTPKNREVIERCGLKGQPHAEVAKALKIGVTTVKARVFRAKRSLKLALLQIEGGPAGSVPSRVALPTRLAARY